MNQYMSDSRHAKIDPRTLTLHPAMQARDSELIRDKRLRAAQEVKQASQDKEILEDLRNGHPIRQSIIVFVVNSSYYVVDGFHRTSACLKYLKEHPNSDLTIPAIIIANRTFMEAFSAAQDANQGHGVGVTTDEIMQSKFRKLIINREFDLSISEVMKAVGCSKGQAAHIAKGLKACGKVLADKGASTDTSLDDFVKHLRDGLENNWYLSSGAYDSKGFPKIRRLSDAVSGKEFTQADFSDSEWDALRINEVSTAINRLIENLGEDYFREGLRKSVKGLELGVSVSLRKKWLQQAGSIEGSESSTFEYVDGF